MKMNGASSGRQSMRSPNFDYQMPGYYFVTICVRDRLHAFGEIIEQEMHLNRDGRTSEEVWLSLPQRFPNVGVNEFVFMPNHMHGILLLKKPPVDVETSRIPACFKPHMKEQEKERLIKQPERYIVPPIGEVLRTFKAASTRLIRKNGSFSFGWQDGYWSRILSREEDLTFVRNYIENNPHTWHEDKLHTPQKEIHYTNQYKIQKML